MVKIFFKHLHFSQLREVADELKAGRPYTPEFYDEASIFFSDIVGFTALSSQSTPMQIIDLLNTLYTNFDDVIERYDVYKVSMAGFVCIVNLLIVFGFNV